MRNVNTAYPALQQGMMAGNGPMQTGYGHPGYMQGYGQPGTGMYGSMQTPAGAALPAVPGTISAGVLPAEESYIENILRLNLGKVATIYMTFENNNQWNAKIFKGVLEAAGRDHIIVSDPRTGMRYLLLMVNLDYITFDEELNYNLAGLASQAAGR